MKRRGGRSIEEIISAKFDIPIDGISKIPVVEIKGDTQADICGCTGILKYSDDEISLKTNIGSVDIRGSRLGVSIFTNGRVGICGKIKSVSFSRGEKRK